MSGKGTGLTTAFKCKKCNENVQQTVGSTSNLSDHLQRCDFTAWDRDINSSKSNSHTAQVVDTEGAVKVMAVLLSLSMHSPFLVCCVCCSCTLCSLFVAFVVHALMHSRNKRGTK
jgi:hypothetical protein